VVEGLGIKTGNEGEAVGVFRRRGQHSHRVRRRQVPPVPEGGGKDGVGRVQDEGAQAREQPHSFPQRLQRLDFFPAPVARHHHALPPHERGKVRGFPARARAQVDDGAAWQGREDVPDEEGREVLRKETAREETVEGRGLRAHAVGDPDTQAVGGGDELRTGDEGDPLPDADGLALVVGVQAASLGVSVKVHKKEHAGARGDASTRAPYAPHEDVGATQHSFPAQAVDDHDERIQFVGYG